MDMFASALISITSASVAVIIGHFLQVATEKRNDKMRIFQCLMTHRATGWVHPEAVNALNSIDIVFASSEAVRKQWHILYEKYGREISPPEVHLAQCKLLELMAHNLGYKGKITWETIQSPYLPIGLTQQIENNTQIIQGQLEWAKAVGLFTEIARAKTTSISMQETK